MNDAPKEPTVFDALRKGTLMRHLFARQDDADAPQPPASPQPDTSPQSSGHTPPLDTPSAPTPPLPAAAPAPAPRLVLRLSGGWLILALLAAFGAGYLFGARSQSGAGAASLAAPPAPDLSPKKQPLSLDGQTVIVTHSALDIGSLPDAFDGNPDTLMRGAADNPFFFEIEFAETRPLTGMDLTVATMAFFTVDVTLTYEDGAQETLSGVYQDLPFDPTVSFAFPNPEKPVKALRVEIEDIREKPPEGFHIHVREVTLR